jgi:hypothetical protein
LSVVFLGLCVFNWSVESMLEVQAGVVWTALLALVLFHTTKGGPMDAKSVIL